MHSADDSESIDDALERDLRTEDQRRYDALADEVIASTSAVNRLIAHLERNPPGTGQVQTVVHKTQGMGAVGVICAAICFLCVLFLIVIFIFVNGSLRDLDAWRSLHSTKIQALESEVRNLKELRK